MKKKIRFRSPVLDFFVITLCICVAGLFLFLFWKDLNSHTSRSDKSKIATITFKNKIAQRKFDDRVVWERLANSSPLYNGDIIRTANLSQAIITFNDGTTLDLSENTMLQIYFSEYEGLQIVVDGGNIQLDASKNTNVAVKLDDGSVVNVDAGSSLIAKAESSGEKTLEVKNGNAKVTSSIGKTAILSLGQSVNLKQDGEIKNNPLTVTSIPKSLRLLNITSSPLSVALAWNMDDNTQSVTVLTSDTKDFSSIKSSKKYTGSNKTNIELLDGTIWWKVVSDKNPQVSESGKITVQKVPPVKIISPAPKGNYNYRIKPPVINFYWEGNEYANHYKLLVSSTPDMKNPILERKLESTTTYLDDLREGTWWYQIIPYYIPNNLGYDNSTAINSFTITKNEEIRRPLLVIPQNEAEIVYKDFIPAQFSWKSDLEDCTYVVLIAKDKDFSNVVLKRETKKLNFAEQIPVSDLNEGTYFWKVIRNSYDRDDITPESEVRSFKIVKYIPQSNKLLYPPENYSAEASQIASTTFIWKLSDENKDAQTTVQFSKTKDFSQILVEKETDGQQISHINLSEGAWYWRIGVMNDASTKEFTTPRKIQILAPLASPVFIQPLPKQELLSYNGSLTQIKWKEIPGADYYNLKFFNDKQELILQKEEIKGDSLSVSLEPQTYSCQIVAVSGENESSLMRQSDYSQTEFSVRRPSRVTLTSPANNSSISGLTALRVPTEFSWQYSKDKPESYEFVLKKRLSNGNYTLVEQKATQKQSYSIQRLPEGTYSYQVLASTAQGIPLNSDIKVFTVTTVPPLKSPLLTYPSNAFVMNGEYLRKNRNLLFEWKSVEGATNYNFVLFKKEQNGKLTQIYTEKRIKNNYVRIKDLSVLDLGNFVWQVTAYCYARDGFKEQQSKASSANFTIDFAAPSQIENLTPERMYSE